MLKSLAYNTSFVSALRLGAQAVYDLL